MPNSTAAIKAAAFTARYPAIGGCDDAPSGGQRCTGCNQSIACISNQRRDDRHVETVGAQSGDASVAKKQSLNGKRNRQRENRTRGTEHDGGDGHAQCVAGCATWQRQVEHHHHERKRRKDGDERNHAAEQRALQPFERGIPTCAGSHIEHATGRGTQIAVRNVHCESLEFVSGHDFSRAENAQLQILRL